MTRDDAQELIQRLVGTPNRMALHEFEFGWVAREILSETERTQGLGLGQGNWVIDHDGTVTAHRSMPPSIIMQEYAAARRAGRTTGRQVWPLTGEPEPNH